MFKKQFWVLPLLFDWRSAFLTSEVLFEVKPNTALVSGHTLFGERSGEYSTADDSNTVDSIHYLQKYFGVLHPTLMIPKRLHAKSSRHDILFSWLPDAARNKTPRISAR